MPIHAFAAQQIELAEPVLCLDTILYSMFVFIFFFIPSLRRLEKAVSMSIRIHECVFFGFFLISCVCVSVCEFFCVQ